MYVIPDIALLADTVTDVMLLPVPHTGCLWGFEQVLRNLFASCAESPSRYSCAGCPVLLCGWGLWRACAVMLFWEPSERASIYSSRFPARGKTEKKKKQNLEDRYPILSCVFCWYNCWKPWEVLPKKEEMR